MRHCTRAFYCLQYCHVLPITCIAEYCLCAGLLPLPSMLCDDCGYSTTCQGYMTAHLRGHAGKRVHPCDVPGCSAVFNTRRSLIIHERKHTGEKPFVCAELGCSYSATCKLLLIAHTKRHKGDLSQKCMVPECGYASSSRASLTAHSRAIHNFIPPPKKAQYRRLYTGPRE